MQSAGLSEQKLLETYLVQLPEATGIKQQLDTEMMRDTISEGILGRFHPAALENFTVLSVVGDGNCLYHAASLALYGTQSRHEHLHLCSALEIILNRNHHDTQHRKYVDHTEDHRVVVSPYQDLVKSVCLDGSYQELSHIYGLIAATGSPFRSYYPPAAANEYLAAPFSRRIMDVTCAKTSLFSAP